MDIHFSFGETAASGKPRDGVPGEQKHEMKTHKTDDQVIEEAKAILGRLSNYERSNLPRNPSQNGRIPGVGGNLLFLYSQ